MYAAKIDLVGRKVITMGKKKKNNNADDTTNSSKKESVFQKIWDKVLEHVIGVIFTVLTLCVTTLVYLFLNVTFSIPNQISILNSKLDGLEKSTEELSDSIEKISEEIVNNNKELQKSFNESISDAKEDLRKENEAFRDGIYATLGIVNVKPTSYSATKLNYSTTDLETGHSQGPSLKPDGIIGEDFETGEEYKAKSLVNKKILVPYKENGQEVYFLGQYNAEYHWDGNCIINVYRKNRLVLVTNANYDNGKLQDYRQVLEGKGSTWIISNRKAHKNYNSGENWSYYKNSEITKKFSMSNVKVSDIIGVEKIKSKFSDSDLEGYYHGRTGNGKYNDDTGKAYLVKYFKDSKYVKTLYQGRFEDGEFEDSTGDAWYIVKEENTNYMYYKGIFEGGTAKYKDDKHFRNPLTKADIDEIIKGCSFNCELSWDFSENT